MLLIRAAQMRVLRRERLRTVFVPLLTERLIEECVVRLEAFPSGEPMDEDEPVDEDEVEPAAPVEEVLTRETLREFVLADLLRADEAGIESEHGLYQFAAYRFTLSPDWMDKPAARELLGANLAEDEKLERLHALLTRG